MIAKEDVIKIVKKYLKDKNREYEKLNIEKIIYKENIEIPYGKFEEIEKNIYTISYEEEGYINPFIYFVTIDADTGEVLFTTSKHGYVEDEEEDVNKE